MQIESYYTLRNVFPKRWESFHLRSRGVLLRADENCGSTQRVLIRRLRLLAERLAMSIHIPPMICSSDPEDEHFVGHVMHRTPPAYTPTDLRHYLLKNTPMDNDLVEWFRERKHARTIVFIVSLVQKVLEDHAVVYEGSSSEC
jgi:hypothetical protein